MRTRTQPGAVTRTTNTFIQNLESQNLRWTPAIALAVITKCNIGTFNWKSVIHCTALKRMLGKSTLEHNWQWISQGGADLMKQKRRYVLINVPYHFHLLSGSQNTCWSPWLLPPRFQDTVKLELGQTTLLQKQIYPKQCLRLLDHGGHNQIKELIKKQQRETAVTYATCHFKYINTSPINTL